MHHVATLRRAVVCALVLPALALTACGDENIPGNAVAKVDDTTIKKATFDHWMEIAARSAQPPPAEDQEDAPAPAVPQPPDFKACVAAKKEAAPEPAKGEPQPKDSDYRAQCKQEYEAMRDQVMQLLIQNEWVKGEAAERDIKVTDAEVKKAFEEQKEQSFPEEKDYQEFLKTSGFTEEDILFRVRLEQLSNKLRDQILEGKDKVSDKELREYYDKNKQRFAQPERRDLRVVLTREQDKAEEAKDALESGESWKSVAKEYSIDEASKEQGGRLLAVAKGQQEPDLDEAVFAAEKGELSGPVKTQFGYYVFTVSKITPPDQQTFEEAKETIRGILTSERQQKAFEEFVKEFQEKWKEKTVCQDGFVTQDCKNAPEPKTDTTAPQPQPQPQPEQPAQP